MLATTVGIATMPFCMSIAKSARVLLIPVTGMHHAFPHFGNRNEEPRGTSRSTSR